MALQKVNTGNFNDLFTDLDTLMGTTLGWTLFDNVSVDEKVYTVPPTTAGFSPVSNPSFIRLFRDTVAFSVRLTIYDGWTMGGGVGAATNPVPAADSVSKNIFDFAGAAVTASYRLYGDAAEGFIAVLPDGTISGNLQFLWIGVLVGRESVANHPNPNAVMYKSNAAGGVAVDFLNVLLAVKVETVAEFFSFNSWVNSTEQHSGLSPIVTAFAWFSTGSQPGEIGGVAFDLFQCSGSLGFGDEITIGASTFRVCSGGGYCVKE